MYCDYLIIFELLTLMSTIMKVMASLNSETVIVTSGFMIGFLYEFKFNKKTLDNPLSTIFNSSISGFIMSIGASIVGGFIPSPMKCIIPLTAVASCAYYKYNDIYGSNIKD